jgi:hypothetical protein
VLDERYAFAVGGRTTQDGQVEEDGGLLGAALVTVVAAGRVDDKVQRVKQPYHWSAVMEKQWRVI